MDFISLPVHTHTYTCMHTHTHNLLGNNLLRTSVGLIKFGCYSKVPVSILIHSFLPQIECLENSRVRYLSYSHGAWTLLERPPFRPPAFTITSVHEKFISIIHITQCSLSVTFCWLVPPKAASPLLSGLLKVPHSNVNLLSSIKSPASEKLEELGLYIFISFLKLCSVIFQNKHVCHFGPCKYDEKENHMQTLTMNEWDHNQPLDLFQM